MALGRRLTEILMVIQEHQPVSVPEISKILKDNGQKGGHKSVAKSVESLGIKGYIAGDVSLTVVRLPDEMSSRVPKRSSFEVDTENDYWGWPVDHTDEEVEALFEEGFGRAPERLIRTGGAVLAGPIEIGERPS